MVLKAEADQITLNVRFGPLATGKVICSVDEINFTISRLLRLTRGAQGNARC
jgi:hypothetical protein